MKLRRILGLAMSVYGLYLAVKAIQYLSIPSWQRQIGGLFMNSADRTTIDWILAISFILPIVGLALLLWPSGASTPAPASRAGPARNRPPAPAGVPPRPGAFTPTGTAAFCPGCGAAVADPEARFCGVCGEEIPRTAAGAPAGGTATEPLAAVSRKCATCGAELDDDIRFCEQCGAKVPDAAEAPPLAKYCVACRAPREESKGFCGECGQPLVGLDVAAGEMRSQSERSPDDLVLLHALLDLTESLAGPEEASGLLLGWCEERAGGDAVEATRQEVRAQLRWLEEREPQAGTVARLLLCWMRLYDGARPDWDLVQAVGRFAASDTTALDPSTLGLWAKACLGWAEESRKRGDGEWASALLRAATLAAPGDPGVLVVAERERKVRRRRAMIGLATAGSLLVLGVLAVLLYRFFNTMSVEFVLAAGFHDAGVDLSARAGDRPELRREPSGILRASLWTGRYTVKAWKNGYAAWESTLVLRGNRLARVEIPPLRPEGAAGLTDVDFAKLRSARDPLLAYVNRAHNADGQGEFKSIIGMWLPVGRGRAAVQGFSNLDNAPHATWASVWLIEHEGRVYEVDDYIGPTANARGSSLNGRPALLISSGDTQQGEGWGATTFIYHDGTEFRKYSESRSFTPSGEEPVSKSDTTLQMHLIPGLSASTARASGLQQGPKSDETARAPLQTPQVGPAPSPAAQDAAARMATERAKVESAREAECAARLAAEQAEAARQAAAEAARRPTDDDVRSALAGVWTLRYTLNGRSKVGRLVIVPMGDSLRGALDTGFNLKKLETTGEIWGTVSGSQFTLTRRQTAPPYHVQTWVGVLGADRRTLTGRWDSPATSGTYTGTKN